MNVSPEYWSCLRKLRYSRKAAESVVMKNPDRRLRFYRCEFATEKHHWHITHAPARRWEFTQTVAVPEGKDASTD